MPAYKQLPEITLGVDATLVASPPYPASYVPSGGLQAGERLRLLGTDENGAWLLVLHGSTLGWIPAIYSRDNIGTLNSVVVTNATSGKCTRYLDAAFTPSQAWTSTIDGSVIVQGILYRPQPGDLEGDPVTLAIEGAGQASPPDIRHTPLPGSGDLLAFRSNVEGVHKGNQIQVGLPALAGEPLAYEALFLADDCPSTSEEAAAGQQDNTPCPPISEPSPTSTSVVITVETTAGLSPEGCQPGYTDRALASAGAPPWSVTARLTCGATLPHASATSWASYRPVIQWASALGRPVPRTCFGGVSGAQGARMAGSAKGRRKVTSWRPSQCIVHCRQLPGLRLAWVPTAPQNLALAFAVYGTRVV